MNDEGVAVRTCSTLKQWVWLAVAFIIHSTSVLLPLTAPAQSIVRINPPHLAIRGAALYSDTGLMVGDSGLVMRNLGYFANKYVVLDAKIEKSVTLYCAAFSNQLRAAIGGSGGTLAYTTNCGASWFPSTLGTTATIRAMASNVAGILTAVGDSGLIARSTNSGKTWTRLASPTSSQLNAVIFHYNDTGFAVGNDTVILETIDAGLSWYRVPFPYDLRAYDSIVHQIDFSSVALHRSKDSLVPTLSEVWVGMERPVMPLRLLKDSLTGLWGKDTIPLPIFPNSGPLHALVCSYNTVIGITSDDYLYYNLGYPIWPDTVNYWQRRIRDEYGDADGNINPSPMRNYCAGIDRSINQFGTGTVIAFAGEDMHAYEGVEYDNYGSWLQNKYPNGQETTSLLGLSIGADGIGYAVGTGAIRQRTGDGGRTWKLTTKGANEDFKLNSVWTQSTTSAIICGWSGLVQRTTDAGKNWDSLYSGTTQKLHGIAFPTTDVGVIVGDFGNIIRSTDTGKTWSPITTPSTEFLFAVAFGNATTGVAVGDASTILRTTDAGQHWSEVNNILTGSGVALRQVEAFPDGTMFARGGTLLIRSTDFGDNWQFVSTPHGDSLGMSFYNSKIGIVAEHATSSKLVPDTASFSFTTNGGASWRPVVVPIWNYDRILFHWLNDHEVLLYGIEGFVVLVDISKSDVKITRMEATGLRAALSLYPNPSSGEVRIEYTTKTSGPVTIELWNEAGKLVQRLFSGEEIEGQHEQFVEIPQQLHGSFFVCLSADGESTVARLSIP